MRKKIKAGEMRNEQGTAGFCDGCIYHNSRAADLHYKISTVARSGELPDGHEISKPTRMWLQEIVSEFLEND